MQCINAVQRDTPKMAFLQNMHYEAQEGKLIKYTTPSYLSNFIKRANLFLITYSHWNPNKRM